MKEFFTKNQAEVYTSIGVLLILYHFLRNGFNLDSYPTGAFILGLGAYMMYNKYFPKKSE